MAYYYRDQKKYIEELKRYEAKMLPKELEEYKMFVKRHKDEEEFDSISFGKLKALYEKYEAQREKKNYDQFFKKSDQEKTN
ncbi:MAG: hypothetical protein WCS69_12175 [Ignavibacteriaceae bacterium]|jgi:hypothetical protein